MKEKEKVAINIQVGNKKINYIGSTRTVKFTTRHGVESENKVPTD